MNSINYPWTRSLVLIRQRHVVCHSFIVLQLQILTHGKSQEEDAECTADARSSSIKMQLSGS